MVNYWGIHNDRAEIDPLSDKAVRIGWDKVGDLNLLDATRDAFRNAVAEVYPDKQTSNDATAGTLYRFACELHIGDIIVSPNRADRTLRIGRITGPYEHRASDLYCHWRPVHWLIPNISRDEFSEAAQNELSAATTLFRLRTSRPEIEILLDRGRSRTRQPDFSWTAFYTELADKLVPYRHRRDELLDIIWAAADQSGTERLFRFMKTDRHLDGSVGPLTDIDPFTVYSPFNRGITNVNRTQIAGAYRTAFGISAPTPTTFDGIPVVDNRNSWFIRWTVDRADDAVDILWDLFEAELAYAADQTESHRENLITAFDSAATGHTRMLTMGAYWVRPAVFTAFDGVNAEYLATSQPAFADRLDLRNKITGEAFLANTEAISDWLAEPGLSFATPAELSLAAWHSQNGDPTSDGPAYDKVATEDDAEPAPSPTSEYSVENIIEDGSFMDIQLLESMIEALRSKKNIILQGPPGTGKTWLARRLGWALCGERDTPRVTPIQFHPSMSYEDFVRGYRPASDGTLKLVDGPLLTAAEAARLQPRKEFAVVIEEINRGNPAQIFGEMLTLIEHDKRKPSSGLNLAYPREDEGTVHLPANLSLIGTMNLADRSLALVDMALRRRFAFFDLDPQFNEAWRDHVLALGYDSAVVDRIATRVTALNQVIASDPNLGKDYGVGHSYFTPGSVAEPSESFSEKWFQRVVRFEIAPLLAEYWFDKPQRVEDQLNLLRSPDL